MKTLLAVLLPLLAVAAPALADDTSRFSFGGDQYVAGQEAGFSNGIERDAFAAGFNVVLSAPVAGDAHAVGYTVTITGPVSGNVYAAGNSVSISGAVDKDVTAIGSTVSITGADPLLGNLRAAAGAIVLDRPVFGSALLAGASITINAPITGDVLISSDSVSFGDKARIDGRVEIRGTREITVPASVASPDRVTFTKVEAVVVAGDAKGIIDGAAGGHGGWIAAVFGALAVIVYGAILLTLFPRRAEAGYRTGMQKPWKSLLSGLLALAVFIGLIPVVAITLIGIPLVPVAIALLVLAALTGFVAGAYFVADRVLGALRYDADTLWKRIGALAMGLIAVWIIGIIPVVGWLLQLGLVLFGLGALTFSAFGRRIDGDFHRRIADETGLTT